MKYSKQDIKKRNITQSNLNVNLLPDSVWGHAFGASRTKVGARKRIQTLVSHVSKTTRK